MKSIIAVLCAIVLSGCASTEYQAYADAHKAQAAAQTARYQALADIAKQGDTTAKVAAVMSLQMSGGQQSSQIAMPKSWADYALQGLSVLLPTAGQIYTVNKQTTLGMRQSDNSTALGLSTNAAFVGIASRIQAPAANVTTIGGNGVIGAGTYSIGANSGQNSGNSGRLAGGGITDNTSVPTVVNQPAPVIVTQPAPITVTQPAPVIVTQPAPITVTQPAPVIVPTPAPVIVRPEVVTVKDTTTTNTTTGTFTTGP
jgi:PBP1b-binding outer membrane lipoprotein LpoB